MTGKRRANHHLPLRVYLIRGAHVLSIRMFKNGNGHVTFRRPDLVEQMNRIIAKHYPGALPAPK